MLSQTPNTAAATAPTSADTPNHPDHELLLQIRRKTDVESAANISKIRCRYWLPASTMTRTISCWCEKPKPTGRMQRIAVRSLMNATEESLAVDTVSTSEVT